MQAIAPAVAGNPAGPVLSLGKIAKTVHKRGLGKAKTARLRLRSLAAKLLFFKDLGRAQKYRTVHCGRSMRGNYLFVNRAADGTGARFTGLVTCGSGWLCPMCCMRIAESRREELSAGLLWVVQTGGRAQLLTYTVPHGAHTMLADTMARFDQARKAFKNSRAYKAVCQAVGRLGSVCSAETTYGIHGWHPHLHEIIFGRRSMLPEEISKLQSEWVRQLLRVGLGDHSAVTDMLLHALDVRGGEQAAEYITKYGREETWGITSELTRQHTKEGRGDHVTPFGLLALAAAGESAPGGRDPRILFQEYAAATFGKRLMTYSPGLRKALRLGLEMTDQQIVDKPLPNEEQVGKLDSGQWKVVLSRNAEAELLDFAATMCVDPDTGQEDLDNFVRWLEHRPRASAGWFVDNMRPDPNAWCDRPARG